MRTFRTLLGAFIVASMFFGGSTTLTSCKPETIYDTITIRDTITVKDTVTITDSTCYNLKDSLIAWYTFNNGTLGDSSGKNNHITFNNATLTTDRFGNANNAYLFDGTSSYMSVPNSASLNPNKAISIMAIVKPNGFYAGRCHGNNILSKGWNDFTNGFYTLRYVDGTGCNFEPVNEQAQAFYGAYGNGTQAVGAGTQNLYIVQKNAWQNVIFTFDGNESKIYVNGTLVRTETRQNTGGFTPNNLALTIGKHGDPAYPYFVNGSIDEIRIYAKALCSGEVKALNKLTK
jgi:hypothetical protein